ncbi:MAG: cytochrome c biogenesis protein CcsA [Parachlamydiaceae bacterium]|nr:cytochrome c biogenesis protein CcsA [Parachlamydiaceae bacterium]
MLNQIIFNFLKSSANLLSCDATKLQNDKESKMPKSLTLILIFCCHIFVRLQGIETLSVPVSYEGRFLPADPYAKKWLFEIHHRSSLKSENLTAFHAESPSAFEFIWQLNFQGHKPWDKAPLFWIRTAEVKELLDLPLKQDRFDYATLIHSIYEDTKSSWIVMQKLLVYHYLKSYQDPANYGGRTTLELSQLSPGLWLSLNGQNLILLEASEAAPWKRLNPGLLIEENIDLRVAPREQSALDDLQELIATLSRFSQLLGTTLPNELSYSKAFNGLKAQGLPPKQISTALDQQHPIRSRLQAAGTLLKTLPGKLTEGEWYSLHALQIKVYDPATNDLQPISNFTLYSDEVFHRLRELYTSLKHTAEQKDDQDKAAHSKVTNELMQLLADNYKTIENKAYKQAAGKQLIYPSENQLAAETLYSNFPFIMVCIGGYALALIALILGYSLNNKGVTTVGASFLMLSFFLHGFLLAIRSYILGRPPVSNMFETLLYVPWIAVLTGLLLWTKYRHTLLMAAGATVSLALLVLLQITHIDSSFTNVQAVLDSQYWLIIHVLLVVGSYGIFILGGVLGHYYLGGLAWHGKETKNLKFVSQFILQSMYLGVALLVPGTLLGGVWAAESWGRFWDWDPKESWAFISICVYLIWIHAYRFNKISHFGLAIGSVIGLLTISFTWYGVNYVLGTGLHSYGFGHGGEGYYYLYLIAEILFLNLVSLRWTIACEDRQ